MWKKLDKCFLFFAFKVPEMKSTQCAGPVRADKEWFFFIIHPCPNSSSEFWGTICIGLLTGLDMALRALGSHWKLLRSEWYNQICDLERQPWRSRPWEERGQLEASAMVWWMTKLVLLQWSCAWRQKEVRLAGRKGEEAEVMPRLQTPWQEGNTDHPTRKVS